MALNSRPNAKLAGPSGLADGLVRRLNWLPLVGSGIAVLLPVPLALVDPSVSWLAFGLFLGLTTAVHLLVDNLVDQVVMARAMTLHPVALIVGLSAAQIVWGAAPRPHHPGEPLDPLPHRPCGARAA